MKEREQGGRKGGREKGRKKDQVEGRNEGGGNEGKKEGKGSSICWAERRRIVCQTQELCADMFVTVKGSHWLGFHLAGEGCGGREVGGSACSTPSPER